MATAAVIGLSTGKRFLSSSFCHPDLAEKFFPVADRGSLQFLAASPRSIVVARKSSHFGTNGPPIKHTQAVKALKESVHTLVPSSSNACLKGTPNNAKEDLNFESSLEVLILLQKSMLEKQWELPFDQMTNVAKSGESCQMPEVARSGVSARQRRVNARRRCFSPRTSIISFDRSKKLRPSVSPELLGAKLSGYVKGSVSDNLLTHAEVVNLSNKIKVGLCLEEHRAKLKDKLRSEPCDKQLAFSLRMSLSELRSKLLECSLAREKLAMSNVRLVMSVAQKYDNLGAEMADLIQGGLIGLLRGIEKFDSSKGFRISTYVYWWIRQGVSRALVENSRTLRLPMHLHERLSSIRNAKIRLEGRGITPSITNLAESLNMSQKKVRNATEAVSKVISLDREAFPSLNGLPGESLHSYIADKNLDNNPWHGFDEWALKDEINKLLLSTLTQRESDIIRLYHGLDNECHTWEDISRQFGLSRERVRQVGLVAMEKLKHEARKRRLDAMLVKH